MAFKTSDSYVDWDFDVTIGEANGTEYPFTFNLYFQKTRSWWYEGIGWRATFTVLDASGNVKHTKSYDTTKSSNRIDVAANAIRTMGSWTEENIDFGNYILSAENITVKCEFYCTYNGGKPAKSAQQESKTVTRLANAEKVSKASAKLKDTDNGNNTVTITLEPGSAGDNNAIESTWCKYKFDDQTVATISTTSLEITDNIVKIPENATKLYITEVASKGRLGDIAYGNTSGLDVKVEYYSKPGQPKNLSITHTATENSSQNSVVIRADNGSDGSNNPAQGVEIYYTTDGTKPTLDSQLYKEPILIGADKSVKAVARTVGTYKGNNESYYYSDLTEPFTGTMEHTKPEEPLNLKITDNNNNTFCISCKVGAGGTNNSAEGVKISYITDNNDHQTVFLQGTKDSKVQTANIDVNVNNIDDSSEINVSAVAQTKGVYTLENNKYLYSDLTAEQTTNVLYYRQATLDKPIITYDKKLTKRSIITTKQHVALYKNTKLEECKVGLYKDSNNNGLGDEVPEIRVVPIVKFPYTSVNQSSAYTCQYVGGIKTVNGHVTFEVLSDGKIKASYNKEYNDLQSVYQAQFNLNDNIDTDGKLMTKFIPGQKYKVQDCMLCYRLKDFSPDDSEQGFRYAEHGNEILWKSDYKFVAIYIRVGVGGESSVENGVVTKTFSPRISYVQYGADGSENEFITVDQASIDNGGLNELLKKQNVMLEVIHKFNLADYDIKKNDRIYTKVMYDIRNGKDENIQLDVDAPISDMHLVESSGVMRVNVDNQWHEGQVWVNVGGIWKEATDVFVNVNNVWKESV